MDAATPSSLADGQRALEAGDWAAAVMAFEPLVDTGEPSVLEAYGLAIWFQGDLEKGMELRQRACLGYGEGGECNRAARLAAWVSHQYLVSGRSSLSNGWLARAERMLENRTACSGAGWVIVERARRAGAAACAAGALEAIAIGRACGDDDLEVFALSQLGRAEVALGRWESGIERLEEAMAAASAGRIRNPNTLGEAYCNLIVASTDAGDWERAAEWCEYVVGFARRTAIMPLYGACRTIHADVLIASGRWSEAEQALTDALAAHARHFPAMGDGTTATLALLRVLQGRLGEAERLLAGRDGGATTLRSLALLRAAEGRPAIAVALLERALAANDGDVLEAARIHAPLIDAHVALGDHDAAAAALGRLSGIADRSGRPYLHALAALGAARIAIAEADGATANGAAQDALDAFTRLGMPYAVAEARLELARALAIAGHPLAIEDARAALASFRELGAVRDADAAAAFLRTLGAGSAPGASVAGDLTARELQVLELVAEGMTNAQVGRALFISEKTAGHHVSAILGKLGVRNRAEAVARAAALGIARHG
jgi:DNA-binding NarL/FixJ family response regulator